MKILTIIVPAYNVEEYLEKTLKSFVAPEILELIEVLIIDDGSTDNTSGIAKRFCQSYPNTFFYISKENGGHGSTINTGVPLAKGKYLKIVDGDDWVNTGVLIELVDFLKNCSVDAVLTNYQTYNKDTQETIDCKRKGVEFKKTYRANQDLIINSHFALTTVCFRTDFVRGLNFKLQEHTFYVDEEFIAIPLLHIQSWCYLDLTLYVYLIGNVNQSISMQSRIKRLDHMERVISRLLKEYSQTTADENHCMPLLQRLTVIVNGYYLCCLIYYPDRKQGRQLYLSMKSKVDSITELKQQVAKKRVFFNVLHSLHVNGKLYDSFKENTFFKKLFQKAF